MQLRSILIITFYFSLHASVHAESAIIGSTNSALQDAIVNSTNSGSVSSSATFNNAGIASGSYNVISVSANGVAVSAMNSVQDITPQADANTANVQSVKGMSVTTNNSGAVAATANFQNLSLTGSHSGVSVQASGSSVSLSNVKQ